MNNYDLEKQYKRNIAYSMVVLILFALAFIVLLSSCRSVNKTHTEDKLKLDSNSVNKSATNIDTSLETHSTSATDNTTIETTDNTIDIHFDSGYIDNGKPITISDSAGKTIIDAGGRKIKDVTKTSKQSIQKNDTKFIDTSTKKEAVINVVKVDSSSVHKEVDNASDTKKVIHFSWLSLWWLYLIIIYLIARYLYKKNLLPFNPSIAKIIFPI